MILATRLIPRGFDAITIWPFILVRPECRDDLGLIEHERVHLREQARWLVLPWWIAYLASRRFRLNAEVRAYRRQIEVGGIGLHVAAEHLLRYRVGISFVQAVGLLQAKERQT